MNPPNQTGKTETNAIVEFLRAWGVDHPKFCRSTAPGYPADRVTDNRDEFRRRWRRVREATNFTEAP